MPLDEIAITDPSAMDEEPMREKQPESRPFKDAEPLEKKLLRWSDPRKTINIAEELKAVDGNSDRITQIGFRVVEEAKLDDDSRTDWLTMSKTAMELAMLVA